MIRVKTYKNEADGKWYVEVVESGHPAVHVGEQLEADADIDDAIFVPASSTNGFESRASARRYLKSYMADMPSRKITGGMH
jgi:hypothetical protein